MKKLYLEFVRGMASLFVVCYHLLGLYPDQGALKGITFGPFGPYSVVMFFILSGCVINISQTVRPKSRKKFFVDRVLRLCPQFFLGILLGLIVTWLIGWKLPSIGQFAGNLFMLSTQEGYIVPSMKGNSAVWSLSFEMFFYLVFLITIGPAQKKRILGWFALSLIAIPLCYAVTYVGIIDHLVLMLAFSFMWLVGYYTYEYRHLFYVDGYTATLSLVCVAVATRVDIPWQLQRDPIKYMLFATLAIPFFRFCLQTGPTRKKIPILLLALAWLLLSTAYLLQRQPSLRVRLASCVLPLVLLPLFALILRAGLKQKVIALVDRLGIILGKYSYSLYIGHMPILFLVGYFFPHHFILYAAVSVALIIPLTWFMESWFQQTVKRLFTTKTLAPQPLARPDNRFIHYANSLPDSPNQPGSPDNSP
jgi:peptidoglycan/LPS O-acetylase OafA/YrhL